MSDHDDPLGGRDRGDPGPDDDEASALGDRAHAEQDLRSTADAIRMDLGRLAAIEDQKLTLDPGDPQVDVASDEAVRLADRIAREARAERQLSHELD
jgi:hypothetical protein